MATFEQIGKIHDMQGEGWKVVPSRQPDHYRPIGGPVLMALLTTGPDGDGEVYRLVTAAATIVIPDAEVVLNW